VIQRSSPVEREIWRKLSRLVRSKQGVYAQSMPDAEQRRVTARKGDAESPKWGTGPELALRPGSMGSRTTRFSLRGGSVAAGRPVVRLPRAPTTRNRPNAEDWALEKSPMNSSNGEKPPGRWIFRPWITLPSGKRIRPRKAKVFRIWVEDDPSRGNA
jgi:hypothetical protein